MKNTILFDLFNIFNLKKMTTEKLHLILNIVWVYLGVKKATFHTPKALSSVEISSYLRDHLGLRVQKISTPMSGHVSKQMIWISKNILPSKISTHQEVGRLLGYLNPLDTSSATSLRFLRLSVGKDNRQFNILNEVIDSSVSNLKIKRYLNKYVRSFELFSHPFDSIRLEVGERDHPEISLIEF